MPLKSDFVCFGAPGPFGPGTRGDWFFRTCHASLHAASFRHRFGLFDTRPVSSTGTGHPRPHPLGCGRRGIKRANPGGTDSCCAPFPVCNPCSPCSRKRTALRVFCLADQARQQRKACSDTVRTWSPSKNRDGFQPVAGLPISFAEAKEVARWHVHPFGWLRAATPLAGAPDTVAAYVKPPRPFRQVRRSDEPRSFSLPVARPRSSAPRLSRGPS